MPGGTPAKTAKYCLRQIKRRALNTAPIVLFAYKRPQHLRRTLDALRSNPSARHSELVIFSDAPRTAGDEQGVDKVRSLCRSVEGFKSVVVIERPSNLGLSRSIIDGVSSILKKHDRVIVVEDDLLVSPFFLDYMNEALDIYAEDETVYSIHGYLFPIRIDLPETFFLKGADCWGWATWSRAWKHFQPDGTLLLDQLASLNLLSRLDFNGAFDYSGMLKQQIEGKVDSWAIRWQASVLLRQGLTLYPGRSLVRNFGFDDSGTHSGETGEFDVILSDTPVRVVRLPLSENPRALTAFENYYRSIKPTLLKRLRRRVRKALRRTAAPMSKNP
ncbi:MAG: glycosyltransferase [Betaproteobacteria bacterium]